MKPSYSTIAFAALAAPVAHAFPAYLTENLAQLRRAYEARAEADGQPGCPYAKRQLPGVEPPFDADVQYVSNSGDNAFVAPSGNDQRGPCPGLNAMANHNYLPHNGVGTIAQFVEGTAKVFGMGADLATFLSVYGSVFNGNLLSFSIGGPHPSLFNLGDLLIQPQGLSGSHNNYESDVSPTRGDLYQYGEADTVRLSQFTRLYEKGMNNGDSLTLDLLADFRSERFDESISENPYFFHAPFAGVVVSAAASTFIYRFMGNKSAENPMGLLNGETLKAFFGVEGDYPDFTYTPGHERIPDNWYKRNPIDYYTIAYFALDAVDEQLTYPKFLSIGGNTGEPNSFVGVDPADLTGGVFNAVNLLQPNNALCFGLQAALVAAPDILKGLLSDITSALSKLTGAVDDALDGLDCPVLTSMDMSLLNQFPGYTELNKDGTYS